MEKYNFFFSFSLVVRRLDGVISSLLALALVKFTDSVDFSNDFSVDFNPLFGVKLLLFKHRKMKHFILYF